MKRTQGIHWGSSSEHKLHRAELPQRLSAVGAAVLFDVLCALLFLWAAASMMSETFGLLTFDIGFYVKQLLVILFVSTMMEATLYLKKVPALLLRLGLPVLGLIWTIWRLTKEEMWEKLTSGLWTVASLYLKEWNSYYDTYWYCPSGKAVYAEASVEFVLLVVVFLLLWLAKWYRKNNIMVFLPALIMIAGLLVGESPEGKGLFLVFAGVLLASNQSFSQPDFKASEGKKGGAGKRQAFGWLPSVVMLFFVCMLVFVAGRKTAEKVVTEHAGDVEDLVMDTANRIADWEFWRMIEDPGGVENMVDGVLGIIDFDRESLDNDEPEFEDIPVLRVTMEKKPEHRVYLKSFYADTYENRVWEKNAESFKQACLDAGFDTEQVKTELAALGVEKLKAYYKTMQLSHHNSGVAVKVFYHDSNTVKAYLPYFSEENADGITVDGEANFRKRKSDEELTVNTWQYGGAFENRLELFSEEESLRWEHWYEKYVEETYLTVPENMSNVKRIAADLSSKDLSNAKLGTIDSTNKERLAKAYLVADWLARNTSYSTILPELPKKTDPIEYFLGTTKKGYCMHYASAGVMILRTMGVPARYASGYVVNREAFKTTSEGYITEVLDNQAHAWAEVYLNGIGWVPVEMTSGYSSLLPTPTPRPTATSTLTPVPTNTPAPANSPTPVPTLVGTPTAAPEKTQIPTVDAAVSVTPAEVPDSGDVQEETPVIVPGTVATATPSPTPTPSPAPVSTGDRVEVTPPQISFLPENSAENELSGIGLEKENNWLGQLAKTVIALLVVLLIVVIVFSPATIVDKFFRFEKAHHRRMLREMKRRGNGRAIKMVNRAIYRKLCFGNIIKAGCTDKEYEKALKEHYSMLWPEDWDRYMDIVKAAEFSLREFTEEEVEFCYKIYRDVIY